MNVIAPVRMALEQFLAWEERQEMRYEFDGERAVPMNGGTILHGQILRSLQRAVDARLDRRRFGRFGPTEKVLMPERSRYPDLLIAPPQTNLQRTDVEGTLVIFEVASPSGLRRDYVEKLNDYGTIPSLTDYVVLSQDTASAQHFSFASRPPVARGLLAGDTIVLPSVGLDLPIAEIYRGAGFSDDELSAMEA